MQVYFDLREYQRAAYCLYQCTSPRAVFLRGYSRYLAGEKQKEQQRLETVDPLQHATIFNAELQPLHVELERLHAQKQLDSFGLYLFALVSKARDNTALARALLVEAVNSMPLNWCAWELLTSLCGDRETQAELLPKLPDHWVLRFWLASLYVELQHGAQPAAMEELRQLNEDFPKSIYVTAQRALAHYGRREFDDAQAASISRFCFAFLELTAFVRVAFQRLFEELRVVDPYRLENLDVYSNIL